MRHLLDLESLSAAEITGYLDTAESMAEILRRSIKRVPTLRGKTLLLLFFEASTRTRHSFELACKVLGADSLALSASTSSATKGESLLDTGRTAEALGVDGVVVRHASSGAPQLLARHLRVSVVNAGDGTHEHPTQGLLDLFSVRGRKGGIAGLRVCIVGDVLHSRVARSAVHGFAKLGASVVLSGPPALLPGRASPAGWPVDLEPDLDRALDGADVVMALRIQKERQEGGMFPSIAEYRARWGIDPARLAKARPDAVLMHPGPVNEGVELAPELMTAPPSLIADQVRAGVAVRMAVLYRLLGGVGA
ncbi:MAG TPA: aspartate carbamoyltransferase catalytic subunit [Bacillota bacterium]|nr:aspartate carbamoyltransferase catalytic subunit [Bacillota bacterium]